MGEKPIIWTIGHSNHEFEHFARLLAGQEIQFVVDVRSYPYSRYASQFDREELEPALAAAGFKYLFLGDELGGRPSREEHYDAEGHALYGAMALEPGFQQAVERLIGGATKYRLALLCSEAQPQDCHRRLLVGKVLGDRGLELRHILPNGSVWEEKAVVLNSTAHQDALFGEGEEAWRSTQSVSHRRRLSTSSPA